MTAIQIGRRPVILLYVVLVLLAVTAIYFIADSQEVSKEWQQLVDAINAGDQAKAETIAEWLDKNGKSVELEALEEASSRFICAWCKIDLGPSDTPEDSHGICSECAKEGLK